MIRYLSAAAIVLVSATAMAQTGNVGINTSTPQTVLDVNGDVRVQQLPAAAGNMTYGGASTAFTPANTVVADANGVLGIVAGMPSNFWSLTGNTGTVRGTNYLGTTDAAPLQFRVNGYQAGYVSRFTSAAGGNVALGYNAAPWMSTISPENSNVNTVIGVYAMQATPTAASSQNVAVGSLAMRNFVNGGTNVAIGPSAMGQATTGGSNVAIGLKTLNSLTTAGNSYNIGIGYLGGASLTGGQHNIFIGAQTVSGLTSAGDRNIFLGQNAGQGNKTGSNNIAIGTGGGNVLSDNSNQLYIGGTIYGTNLNDPNGVIAKVGIRTSPTTLPTENFDVNGTVRVRQLPPSGQTNAIYTSSDATSTSDTKTYTFTATRTVVADANGVLGYVTGIPDSSTNQSRAAFGRQGSVSASIRAVSGGSITDTDYTVLATGNISLPAPTDTNKGRIYNIVNDSAAGITVTGNFRQNGADAASITVSSAATVQSTGSRWVVISRN